MKKLILVGHPDIKQSIINSRWIEELKKYPELFTVHNIYEAYPDGVIDIEKEQGLVEAHEALVLQFPLYWFNCTPLIKQWLDIVFTYGWAYGSKANGLRNKKLGLAISAGIKEKDFQLDGEIGFEFDSLLYSYKSVARYCNAVYSGHFVLFDTHEAAKNGKLEESASIYIDFIKQI